MLNLPTVAAVTKDSFAGQKTIVITSLDNVGDDLSITNSEELFVLNYRYDSAVLSTSGREGKGGYFSQLSLVAIVPKRRIEVERLISKLGNRKVCVYCTDRNDYDTFLIPARFSHSYNSGGQLGQSNAYELRFTATETHRGIYITNADLDIDNNDGTVPGDGTIEPSPGTGDPSPTSEVRLKVVPAITAYTPTAYNNTEYLNSVIIAADGSKWIIDYEGRGMKVSNARKVLSLTGLTTDSIDISVDLPDSFEDVDNAILVVLNGVQLRRVVSGGSIGEFEFDGASINLSDNLEADDKMEVIII